MAHRALFRDDRGNLQIRSFATAAEAAAVSCDRELPATVPPPARTTPTPGTPAPALIAAVMARRGGEIRHTEFARRLGIHPRTVKRLWLRGGLPGAKQHSERILVVPVHLLRLAETFGLRQVEVMAKAGTIS